MNAWLMPFLEPHAESSRLLIPPSKHPAKHLHPDSLPSNLALGLIFCIRRDCNLLPVNSPSTGFLTKLGQRVPSQIQPAAQHTCLNLPERLAHLACNSYSYQILEPRDVGIQVRVEVVALECGPELRILG
jgi:hypothetical protein